jgi:hypothetical protein
MYMIAIDRDPSYAPCSYLLCVAEKEAGSEDYGWNTRDDSKTVLVQVDFDYPGIAQSFGWDMGASKDGCDHEGTDGTVVCPACGKTTSQFIQDAGEFLDATVEAGTVVKDPGYFA